MKKKIIALIIFFTVALLGCGDKNLTPIYFEFYNQVINEGGQTGNDNEFTFEINNKRYEIMDGYTAVQRHIIESDNDNRYKIILIDENKNIVFSMMTEQEYDIGALCEYMDKNGKVYIMYSIYDTMIGSLHIEDLKKTHILEMDMNNYTVTQEYDFGESIVVLTVHDGYVYTMENGRVYRKLLGEEENRECMGELGFQKAPKVKDVRALRFFVEVDGIKVVATLNDFVEGMGYRQSVLLNTKYTDTPIECE